MGGLPVLVSTHGPFVMFSPPVLLMEGSDRAAWWAPGEQLRSTHQREFTATCKTVMGCRLVLYVFSSPLVIDNIIGHWEKLQLSKEGENRNVL